MAQQVEEEAEELHRGHALNQRGQLVPSSAAPQAACGMRIFSSLCHAAAERSPSVALCPPFCSQES